MTKALHWTSYCPLSFESSSSGVWFHRSRWLCLTVMIAASGCGSDPELAGPNQRSLSEASVGESHAPSTPVAGGSVSALEDGAASDVEVMRRRFSFKPTDLPVKAQGLLAGAAFARDFPRDGRAVIPKALSPKFETLDSAIVPRWAGAHTAQLSLSSQAESGFSLQDEASKLSVRVHMNAALAAEARPQAGMVLYPGAGPDGGDVVHRVTPHGTEDYVTFEAPPKAPELHYTLDLGPTVAGLRLVGNVLELVDDSGAPRLRATAPMVVDANGTSFPTTLSVTGCNVDEAPSPPWGRTPVAPGAAHCTLTVSWGDVATYPILVDPSWTTTANLATARVDAQSVSLSGGKVLVTGGLANDWVTCLASSEVFDPTTQTWASVGSMSTARCAHALVKRASGQALASGGYDSTFAELNTTETFDVTTGSWSRGPNLLSPRTDHEAVLLSNGDVLIAGGSQTTSERLRGNTWQAAATLPASFINHTLTPLSSSKALLVGGDQVLTYSSSLNIWSPVTGAPKRSRYEHRTTVLKDGRILITQSNVPSADLYDPVANSWGQMGGMFTPRSSHTATVLSDGRVLLVGGYAADSSVDVNAELFNPTWGTFAPAPELTSTRVGHIAAALPNGSVLVAGGLDFSTYEVTSNTVQLGESTLASTITEYKLPASLDGTVTSSTKTELWAAVARPKSLSPGRKYPLLVFLHGNHGTCGTGTNPRDDWSCEYTDSGTCPSGFVVTPSHRGYDYVASELAASGYIVVSINANRGITCGGGDDGDWGFNLARGRLILRHLQQLSEWHRGVTATPASLGFALKGVLDFTQVGLMGHSRGGEGARAAYEQFRDLASPWPARIVEPLTIRGIFEIGPVDGQSSRVLNADGTKWNVLLPMCDGDVSDLQGVRPFDRMLGLTLASSGGPKSTYIAWGTNHNFFNTEWQVSDSGGCGNHEALFPGSPGSIPQRQIGLRSMFDFFRAHVGADATPKLSDLFNPELYVPFESRVDRGYSPGESAADHLKLEEFTKATGTSYFNVRNVHSRVTVSHEVPPEHDDSLKAALVRWTSNSESTYFQVNFANTGSGIDLSAFDLLDLRVGRASDSSNNAYAHVDVQLVNSNDSLSSPVALGDFVGGLVKPGEGGWSGAHVMLPTARIPLSYFGSAQLGRIRGVRFTPRSTPNGAVYLANIRATHSTYVGDATAGLGAAPLAQASVVQGPAPNVTRTIASGNAVEAIATSASGNHVEVSLSTTTPFPVRDQMLMLQVGGVTRSQLSRRPRGDARKLVFVIPKAEFDGLASGDSIRVQFGGGPGPQWDFGQLDKSRAR